MYSLNRTLDLRVLTWAVELEPSVPDVRVPTTRSPWGLAAITRFTALATCRQGMCHHHRHVRSGAKPSGRRIRIRLPIRFGSGGIYPPRAASPVRRDHGIRVLLLLAMEWMNRMCVSTCQTAPCWDTTATPVWQCAVCAHVRRVPPPCSSWSERGGTDRAPALLIAEHPHAP
jgi:hypothetical protein